MKSKFWTLILSLVVAFGLWLYVITVISPESEETYYDIPVTYQNDLMEERGLMIVSEKPAVTLRLQGNRIDLNNLNSTNISVLVNLAGVQAPGSHLLEYEVKYPGNIQSNKIIRLTQSPGQVTVKVENKIKKNVEVVVETLNTVPDGFVADKQNVMLDYPVIEVTGPESVVSKIAYAKVQVDLNNQVESIIGNYFYTLCDADGGKVEELLLTKNVDSVNLELTIRQLKEIPLTLNIIDGGGATEDSCDIKMSRDTIMISGSEAKLKELDSLEIGTVKLAELKENTNILEFEIVLPEGVTNATGENMVAVTITFPNLGRKVLQIPSANFVFTGVPEGYEVVWVTEVLDVELRGPRELVAEITAEDVTITLDFAGEEPGNVIRIPKIALAKKYRKLGAISANTITATLREIVIGTES